MKNKTKLIFIIIVSFLLILISYFTFNEDIRRKALTYIFVTHDYYQLKRLTYDLQNKDFSNASKKISSYINLSKKFSSEKSYMIPGIYNAIELSVSKAIEQEDFNHLEKPLLELVEMEPKLYKPNVWLARALSDNDYEKSIELLKKAISISPIEEDAYREILRIAQLRGDKSLTDEYCKNFFKSQLGGNTDVLDFGYLFNSNNLKKFAIKFKPIKDNDKFYYHSGLVLGEFLNYDFMPDKPLDINGINLYFSFLPGINIIIKEITVHTKNNKKIIPTNDLIITSASSYIEDNNEEISIYSLKQGDEIIRINFKNTEFYMKKIEKIQLKINFKKMKLVNNFYCN
jgi:hypothetical protein